MMNYNISVYMVFTTLMVLIIVIVGRYFYTNGKIFILSLLSGHIKLADTLNKALLTGYYLLNIGYTFLKIQQWPKISSLDAWFATLTQNIGVLVLILALLHYANMLFIFLLAKSTLITHKSI